MNTYGIDVNNLEAFFGRSTSEEKEWGTVCETPERSEFGFSAVSLKEGGIFHLRGLEHFESTLFLEDGFVQVGEDFLSKGECMSIQSGTPRVITAKKSSALYIFSGPPTSHMQYLIRRKTSDYRDKYWGSIETIHNGEYSAKRLQIRKGQYASLEFHCQKREMYFVHSGKLLIRLRASRAEDRFFELKEKETLFMPPGLMHQRGGLEDSVIIEVSTRDSDSDSFLVEDGQKTPMPELRERLG